MGVGTNATANEALTDTEYKILELAAEGFNQEETGKKLHLSYQTIKWYWKGIRTKLDARNITHAVAIAYQEGMLSGRMVVKRFILEVVSDTNYRDREHSEEDTRSIELAIENAKDAANDQLNEGLSCKIREYSNGS
jgi:DNA-binding CsgD family transcriptional regulator